MAQARKKRSIGDCPPCLPVVHIDVLGVDHPPGHRFQIHDPETDVRDEALEGEDEPTTFGDRVTYRWNWQGESEKHVWLVVDADEGDSIRLPLFEHLSANSPRDQVLCPVLPLNLIGVDEPIAQAPIANVQAVPVRPGFVYVFWEGMLWRELAVVVDDRGQTRFHDVPVAHYREEDPREPLIADRRQATGSALQEIWVPFRDKGQSIHGRIQMAFSEVQWSAQRIHHLEHNRSARNQRTHSLRNARQEKWVDRPGAFLDLNHVEPQRAREPLLEMQLPSAGAFLRDLDGDYGLARYDEAREEQNNIQQDGETVDKAWIESQATQTELGLTAALRHSALEDLMTEAEGGAEEAPNRRLWEEVGPGEDVLGDARDRGIAGLALGGELYPLRRALTQANAGRAFQKRVLQQAAGRAHYDSADLVQQAILPKKLGGTPNPLHEYADSIDLGLTGKLHTALGSAHRAQAVNAVKTAQKRLLACMSDHDFQQRLADHFSLEAFEAVSGFALVDQVLDALLHNAETTDRPWLASANPDGDTECAGQLTCPQDNPAQEAARFVAELVREDSPHPLHAMLFPQAGQVALDERYTPPEEDDPQSLGTGAFRAALWARMSRESALPEPGDAPTLETATLWALPEIEESEIEPVVAMGPVAKMLDILAGRFMAHIQSMEQQLEQLTGEARTLSMDSHSPMARLVKAMNPEQWSELRLMSADDVDFRALAVLGVHDPETGLRLGLNEDDRKALRREHPGRKIPDPGEVEPLQEVASNGEKGRFYLFVAPVASKLAREHRELRQKISRKRSLGQRLDRLGLPYVVFLVELWNLRSETQRLGQTSRERGLMRAGAGAGAAALSLGAATLLAAEQVALRGFGATQIQEALNRVMFRVEGSVLERALPAVADQLPREITRRMLGVTLLGLFETGLKSVDAVHAYRTGDRNAAVATGVSAAGVLMSTWGTVAWMGLKGSGGAVAVLGLSNPVSWVVLGIGFTLGIGGAVVASWLRDDELEQWLKNGPFGDVRHDAFRHLWGEPGEAVEAAQESREERGFWARLRGGGDEDAPDTLEPEREAFYRLASLLAGVRVEAELFTVPYEQQSRIANDEGDTPVQVQHISKQLNEVNLRVRVTSNLAPLLDESDLHVHFGHKRRIQRRQRRGGPGPAQNWYVTRKTELTPVPGVSWDAPVRYKLPVENGYVFWLHMPRPSLEKRRTIHEFPVMARVVSPLGTDREWVFPAPPPKDPLVFDPKRHGAHGEPDFERSPDAFWSTETVSRARAMEQARRRKEEQEPSTEHTA